MFQTGRLRPFCQRLWRADGGPQASDPGVAANSFALHPLPRGPALGHLARRTPSQLRFLDQAQGIPRELNSPRKGPPSREYSPPSPVDADRDSTLVHPGRAERREAWPCGPKPPPVDPPKADNGSHNISLKRFPFSNFKHFLTLFSKFFASFPHGTFSLSVSRRYLALDEVYHPFRAAFSNNPTL